jgi:hypothetical protein
MDKTIRGDLSMIEKLSTKLIFITLLVAVTGLGFFILEESETQVSINGVVCNHSSTKLWLALTEGERTGTFLLAPDQCTDFFKQDAEAIWASDCSTDPCQYQAWKLGAGRFTVYNDAESASASVLRIRGWGAGSRWHVTEDWPKPELSSLTYSLVR